MIVCSSWDMLRPGRRGRRGRRRIIAAARLSWPNFKYRLKSPMRKNLPLPYLFLAVAALLAAGTALRWHRAAPADAPALQAVTLFPQPRVLPDFNLRQSDGTALVPGELKGHWTLVFLGFTHCPDVCPTTLAQLAQAQNQWQGLPDSTRPRVLFVSVDPDRDTPDRIGEYAS